MAKKDESKGTRRKFLRYKEACQEYGICENKMHDLAIEAGAVYKIDRIVLINCDTLEEHLDKYYKIKA